MSGTRTPSVAIIGAGMSGLCMAAQLKMAGIDTFTIYEKAGDLGGTWRDNTYPGLACDIPSRFYQFTFSPKPDWTHLFSPGAEIWGYFDSVADRFGLKEHIEFNTKVVAAEFADDCWRLRTDAGDESTVDFLISATGILHHPRYPQIAGLDTFEGSVFHSARWDHDVAVEGKRVAVIGTGSTGAQIVTALAGVTGRLELFQRTAQWVFPLPNPSYSRRTHALQKYVPGLSGLTYRCMRMLFEFFARALIKPGLRRRFIARTCRTNLLTVRDPDLRRKLTPDYQPMCKRLVISSGFYKAVQKPNVEVVTAGIDHIAPEGIVTDDGVLHEVDVLVLATGFDAHAYMRPLELVGDHGLTLSEAWEAGAHAYHTVALPGFPNFFMLMGPHSPVGNYSLTAIAESQVEHIMGWIQRWREGKFSAVAPTQQATARFNAHMRASMPGTVWVTGCQSWYLGKDGLPELWPWTPDRHRAMLRHVDPDDFDVRHDLGDSASPATLLGRTAQSVAELDEIRT
jgi:cation diffusion facilitator CzcD-associated flavoprotein CzcO